MSHIYYPSCTWQPIYFDHWKPNQEKIKLRISLRKKLSLSIATSDVRGMIEVYQNAEKVREHVEYRVDRGGYLVTEYPVDHRSLYEQRATSCAILNYFGELLLGEVSKFTLEQIIHAYWICEWNNWHEWPFNFKVPEEIRWEIVKMSHLATVLKDQIREISVQQGNIKVMMKFFVNEHCNDLLVLSRIFQVANENNDIVSLIHIRRVLFNRTYGKERALFKKIDHAIKQKLFHKMIDAFINDSPDDMIYAIDNLYVGAWQGKFHLEKVFDLAVQHQKYEWMIWCWVWINKQDDTRVTTIIDQRMKEQVEEMVNSEDGAEVIKEKLQALFKLV